MESMMLEQSTAEVKKSPKTESAKIHWTRVF